MTRAAIGRFGGVGDALIAASVLPILKQRFDTVDVLTSKPQGLVFENHPDVNRVIYPVMEKIPDGLAWQHWFDARGQEYDLFVNLSHSIETQGCFHEAQTQFWWPAPARRKFANHNYLELAHDACGMPYDCIGRGLFYPTPEEQDKARTTAAQISSDGPWIAWTLAGSRLDKVYPYAPMAVARLVREIGPVVLFGGAGSEILMAEQIMAHVGQQNGSTTGLHIAISPDPKVHGAWYRERGLDPDQGGNWPIRRALATAMQASLVIGPDTGVMWATAFEAMAKIVLLSHASPENITKHWHNCTSLHADPARVDCWPCHRLHNSAVTCRANAQNNGAACISDISVAEVIGAAEAALADPDYLTIHEDKIEVIKAGNGADPAPPAPALYIGLSPEAEAAPGKSRDSSPAPKDKKRSRSKSRPPASGRAKSSRAPRNS